VDIEFADFQVAEVDSIEVSFDFFQPDIFVTKDLAYEYTVLVPTDIARTVYSSSLKVCWIDVGLRIAR
jgi:hypothetical protein